MTYLLRGLNHFGLATAIIFAFHGLLAGHHLKLATEGDGNLAIAEVNPYFSGIAEDFAMQRLFQHSLSNESKEGMAYYLDWAEGNIAQKPNGLNFRYLISAYSLLSQQDNACLMAEKASYIYNQDLSIIKFMNTCKR